MHVSEEEYYRDKAEKKWLSWRLVFEGGITPSEVKQMSYDEVMEANQALNISIEKHNQAMENAKTQN